MVWGRGCINPLPPVLARVKVKVLLILSSMEFAAAAVLATCSDALRSGVIINPKSFSLTVTANAVP